MCGYMWNSEGNLKEATVSFPCGVLGIKLSSRGLAIGTFSPCAILPAQGAFCIECRELHWTLGR